MGFYSKAKVGWGMEDWRVFWDSLPYRSVSKGFPTEKKARGFKRYLWRAFKIRSFIKQMSRKGATIHGHTAHSHTIRWVD